MFKFDVNFRNIEVINNFKLEKSINSDANMLLYTPQFKHKNNQKASTDCAERCLMLYVNHETSSATSRNSSVKLMTDSYQFWVAH